MTLNQVTHLHRSQFSNRLLDNIAQLAKSKSLHLKDTEGRT